MRHALDTYVRYSYNQSGLEAEGDLVQGRAPRRPARLTNGGNGASAVSTIMSTFYQVGKVCELSGLTPRALHYYDEIGLLVPTERLAGGHRLYTAQDLERIEQIKDLKRLLGLSLSEIKRILDADEAQRQHLADAKRAADPARRRRAVESALEITEAQLGSVRDMMQQLGRLQRHLARQVRELRRLWHQAGVGERTETVGGGV